MTTPYSPDLTGTDPNYAVSNDVRVIYETGQRVTFDVSIFATSLTVTEISTLNTPLVRGVDWDYISSDIDVNETSKMKTYSPTFNAVLLTGIEFLKPVTAQFSVSLGYQKLYPVSWKINVFNNQQVNLTPDLVVSILARLADVELLTERVPNTTVNSSLTPKLLDIDLTGTATANLILSEPYNINVLQHQNVINPLNGAFYKGTEIVILNDGSSTLLVLGVDYQIYGFDVSKTRTTTSTKGLYNLIVITRPYVGEIFLSYQAYGGVVTRSDVATIYDMVQNVNNYLDNTDFITATSIADASVVQSVLTRVGLLESNLRALINSGSPTYGDVTGTGTTVVFKLSSVDTAFHWWSIASLYKVSGSNTVINADRMHLRFRAANAKLSADVFVNIDMNVSNPFTIDALAVNQDLVTTPVVMPQFRIIYTNNVGAPSGVILQIGFPLASLVETVAVEDLSGSQSCWRLLTAPTTAILPQDNTITLPDGVSIYDTTISASKSIAHMMPNSGYTAWAGTLAIQSMSSTPISSLLPSSFIVSDIKTVKLTFVTGTSVPITVNVPMSLSSSSAMMGSAYVPSSSPSGTPTLVDVSITLADPTHIVINPELTAVSPNMTLISAAVKVV